MKQLTKHEFHRRSTLVTRLVSLIELNQEESVAQILCYLTSRHGKEKNPYYMSDNEFLGVVELELKRLENGDDTED